MNWDDLVAWVTYSWPWGPRVEKDGEHLSPKQSVLLMVCLMGLLFAVAGVVWLIG